jgi:hypothetical protein
MCVLDVLGEIITEMSTAAVTMVTATCGGFAVCDFLVVVPVFL